MTRTALTLFVVVLCTPMTASAFKQTMSCDPSGEYECRSGEVAKAVRWDKRCVQYYVSDSYTDDLDDARALAAIQGSFTTWSDVTGSELLLEYAGLTNEDRVGHVHEPANIVVWRDENWPYTRTPRDRNSLALTSVTFDRVTGIIVDADIEINSEYHRFTTSDANVDVDLRNAITHEVGHFIGLDHSPVLTATMYDEAPAGEVDKRTLEADDIAGLMATYPAVGIVPECEELPDYYYKTNVKEKDGCCATQATPTPGAGLFALVGGLLVALRRRRKAQKRVEV